MPILFSDLYRLSYCCIINSLKDFLIEVSSFWRFKRNFHSLEYICETLNSDPYGSMLHVRIFSLHNRIEIEVDNFIKVSGDDPCNFDQFLIIKSSIGINERWQSNTSEIANSNFFRRCILNDFSAQITGFNRTQILLVRFSIACIFEEHIRCPCLNLRVNYCLP